MMNVKIYFYLNFKTFGTEGYEYIIFTKTIETNIPIPVESTIIKDGIDWRVKMVKINLDDNLYTAWCEKHLAYTKKNGEEFYQFIRDKQSQGWKVIKE